MQINKPSPKRFQCFMFLVLETFWPTIKRATSQRLPGPELFNPISCGRETHWYELEVSSRGPSLGDDWTNVPSSRASPQSQSCSGGGRPSGWLAADRNTEWRALPIPIVISMLGLGGGWDEEVESQSRVNLNHGGWTTKKKKYCFISSLLPKCRVWRKRFCPISPC